MVSRLDMFHMNTFDRFLVERQRAKRVCDVSSLNQNLEQLFRERRVSIVREPVRSASRTYLLDFAEWFDTAAVDFVRQMTTNCRHFGVEACEDKQHRVLLGGLGTMWLDLPVVGAVRGTPVTKWTRAFFVNVAPGSWEVRLDPIGDKIDF